MTDHVWSSIQLSFLRIFVCRKRNFTSFWWLLLSLLVPTLATPNKSAIINIHRSEKPNSQPQLSASFKPVSSSSISKDGNVIAENIRGKFADVGNVKEAEGRLHMVCECSRVNCFVLTVFKEYHITNNINQLTNGHN